MNTAEATVILREASVTTSEEMVRRWCREGKLPATRGTRHEGWQIELADLQEFAQARKLGAYSNEYRAGYDAGEEAADAKITELRDALKKTLRDGDLNSLLVQREDIQSRLASALRGRADYQRELAERMATIDQVFFTKPGATAHKPAIRAHFALDFIKINGTVYEDDTHNQLLAHPSPDDFLGRVFAVMKRTADEEYQKRAEADQN